MIWRIVRSRGFIPIVLILGALLYWKIHNGPPKVISVGYIAERNVILWNSLAQVRESVGEAHYGDRVEVIRVEGPAAQVRTASGTIGWIRDSQQMMDSDLWEKSTSLFEKTRALPVQARGRTKTLSNVRVEPGRDGKRIFQFARGTRVFILARSVADAPQGPEENSMEGKTASAVDQEKEKSKQEDWLLVLRAKDTPGNGSSSPDASPPVVKAATGDAVSAGPSITQSDPVAAGNRAGQVAGWVLARFVEIDLPDPVKDYASSADLHVVAWFELNRVPDGSGGEAPQYLVAGSHGGEGSVCDFTMLRVYTWSTARKHYETAFVESEFCGSFPIRVSNGAKGPEFQFPDVNEGGAERNYVMYQTSVHRLKGSSSRPAHSRK